MQNLVRQVHQAANLELAAVADANHPRERTLAAPQTPLAQAGIGTLTPGSDGATKKRPRLQAFPPSEAQQFAHLLLRQAR